MPPVLIERESQLAMLDGAFSEPSIGAVVLVAGEAGYGKTSLIEVFLEGLDHRYRLLTAACEPVGIPTGFAPLFELLDEFPPDLAADVRAGSGRAAVYAGMLDLIKNDRLVLVIEDLHWADEATLGLVRYLGRRIGPTGSRLIVTYRLEELDFNPPLQLVVADLGSTAVRVQLPPLTVAGVEKMVGGLGLDPGAVHRATLGNPFFVEEVASHPDMEVPPNIQAAVLATVGMLPDDTLEFLRMVSLSPDGVALDQIGGLGDETGGHTDLGFQRRLLVSAKGRIACRHELIRQSLMSSIPPATNQRLHQRLLEALESHGGGSPETARLAHHAIGASLSDKAWGYSLQAARDAAASGAHRESAFHYANALEYATSMDPETLDETLLQAAKEHCVINAFDTAALLARRRVDPTVSPMESAAARAWVAFFEARKNDLQASRAEAEAAIGSLDGGPPSHELALALAVLSWLEVVEGNWDAAVATGVRAVAMAHSLGSAGLEVYAATNTGTARWLLGDPAGLDQVAEAAQLGLAADRTEFTAKALNNLGVMALQRGDLAQARQWFTQLQDFTTSYELDAWYIAAVCTMAWINVASGRLDDADRDLEVVSGQKTCVQTEIEALVVAARLRMRRDDPGGLELAESVFQRLEGFDDHEAQVNGCVLAMEGAWLGVVPLTTAISRYTSMSRSPVLHKDHVGMAQIAFWAHRLGVEHGGMFIGSILSAEVSGAPEEASEKWRMAGFAMEAAITRAMVPGADLEEVFAELIRMGMHGVTRGLRRELQRRGVAKVPRGHRPDTVANPARLTSRELDVLELVSAGLSNSAIAEELYISEKTAGHHVSAILTKLQVPSRGQAAALAVASGWVKPSSPK